MAELIAITLVLFVCLFDALRDAWMKSEGWWKRHTVKWISFYTPLAFISYMHVRPEYWIPLTALSWVVWRLSLRYIGGKIWPSHWASYWKKLFK
jgi:hypothetical protein|tara:strand:- start:1504 stop:1785 length:282 start_codon:yes stop_codon:yes gene_type:complete